MSTRAHFWFRILAVTAILAAEFGPRLWNSAPTASTTRVMADSAQ
jgi:hypothetical protein